MVSNSEKRETTDFYDFKLEEPLLKRLFLFPESKRIYEFSTKIFSKNYLNLKFFIYPFIFSLKQLFWTTIYFRFLVNITIGKLKSSAISSASLEDYSSWSKLVMNNFLKDCESKNCYPPTSITKSTKRTESDDISDYWSILAKIRHFIPIAKIPNINFNFDILVVKRITPWTIPTTWPQKYTILGLLIELFWLKIRRNNASIKVTPTKTIVFLKEYFLFLSNANNKAPKIQMTTIKIAKISFA